MIDSRDKNRPALVFPDPHPDCQRPHFDSPVQVDLLKKAIRIEMRNTVLQAELRHATDGCEDDHCSWCWLAHRESQIRYHAEARVMGERLALAERALRNRSDHQAFSAWRNASRVELEDAVSAEQENLRQMSMPYLPHYPWSD